MWIEHLSSLADCCNFYPPASLAQIEELEATFAVTFPEELRSLLLETNGLSVSPHFEEMPENDCCFSLVSSVEEIRKDNLEFRALDDMSDEGSSSVALATLLFVASDINGDYFAYRVYGGSIPDLTLYCMPHDDDWTNLAPQYDSLSDRLERVLTVLTEMDRAEN